MKHLLKWASTVNAKECKQYEKNIINVNFVNVIF